MAKQLRIKNKITPIFNKEDILIYDKLKVKENYVPIEYTTNIYPNISQIKFKEFDIIDELVPDRLIMQSELHDYMSLNYPDTYKQIKKVPVLIRNADFSNVKNMTRFFKDCNSLEKIPDIDLSSLEYAADMFKGCNKLKSFPNFNFKNLIELAYFLDGCYELESFPLIDTSKVVHMNQMFQYCTKLKTIPKLNTSKVTDMSYMFFGDTSLESIPSLDTSICESFEGIFTRCIKLTDVGYLNTSSAKSLRWMFIDCNSLKSIPWEIDMTSCTLCTRMFSGTSLADIRLKNVPSTLDLSDIGSNYYTVVNYI